MPEPIDPRTTLAAWRAAHPQATLADIEGAVDQHLSAARAALIADLATDLVPERTACPGCGTAMAQNGSRTVTLTTAHEGRVPLTGPHYVCPACGAGLFPPR